MSCLAALLHPVVAQEPASAPVEPEGLARILGRVQGQDGRTPQGGVTVVAYNLRVERFFRSEPTNRKGSFAIEELPFGYYEVAVETPLGLFVGNGVVNVPPAGKAIILLTVTPPGPTEAPARTFADGSDPVEGLARIDEKLTTSEFWKSPKGIAILGGIGGTALLLFAAGDDTEQVATDFTPEP